MKTRGVKAVVRKVLGRMTETKYVAQLTSAWGFFNSQILGANQWATALPPITQGDEEHQRIGNSILPKRSQVKLMLRLTPQDLPSPDQLGSDARDVTVVIYYGFVRKYKNVTDVQTNSATLCTQLLENGDGHTSAFLGNPEDVLYPVNNKVFNLKKKVVRLFKGKGHGNVNQGINAGQDGQPPAVYSKVVTLNYKHKSKCKFSDDTATTPEDFAPVWAIGYYYTDSALDPDTGGVSPIQYRALRQLWFSDM